MKATKLLSQMMGVDECRPAFDNILRVIRDARDEADLVSLVKMEVQFETSLREIETRNDDGEWVDLGGRIPVVFVVVTDHKHEKRFSFPIWEDNEDDFRLKGGVGLRHLGY